jgi:hypothetical protein
MIGKAISSDKHFMLAVLTQVINIHTKIFKFFVLIQGHMFCAA